MGTLFSEGNGDGHISALIRHDWAPVPSRQRSEGGAEDGGGGVTERGHTRPAVQ